MRSTGAAVTIFAQLDHWALGEARSIASRGPTTISRQGYRRNGWCPFRKVNRPLIIESPWWTHEYPRHLNIGEKHGVAPCYSPEISWAVRHEASAGGEYLLARSAIPEFTWASVRKAFPAIDDNSYLNRAPSGSGGL